MPDDDNRNEAPPTSEKEKSATNPVYTDSKQRVPLRRIHLYRILGNDEILAYRTDRPNPVKYDDMEQEIDTILSEIHNGDLDPITSDLGGMGWWRRNYFAVSFEIEDDFLLPCNAVTFERISDNSNNTFLDGKDIFDQGVVRRFFCINHMKMRNGGDLPKGQTETFEFTVRHHHAPHRDHNATGTNTGPP